MFFFLPWMAATISYREFALANSKLAQNTGTSGKQIYPRGRLRAFSTRRRFLRSLPLGMFFSRQGCLRCKFRLSFAKQNSKRKNDTEVVFSPRKG
jgi:hypothetical protein